LFQRVNCGITYRASILLQIGERSGSFPRGGDDTALHAIRSSLDVIKALYDSTGARLCATTVNI
jgi:hypothetical protein